MLFIIAYSKLASSRLPFSRPCLDEAGIYRQKWDEREMKREKEEGMCERASIREKHGQKRIRWIPD
jgi:hypothetical protein